MPTAHTVGLQPKFLVPPLPHPCPHEHIEVLATQKGLLLRPHLKNGTRPESHVRVTWGKDGKVEEINTPGEEGQDWSESVVVYGIIGVISLFTGIHYFSPSLSCAIQYLCVSFPPPRDYATS